MPAGGSMYFAIGDYGAGGLQRREVVYHRQQARQKYQSTWNISERRPGRLRRGLPGCQRPARNTPGYSPQWDCARRVNRILGILISSPVDSTLIGDFGIRIPCGIYPLKRTMTEANERVEEAEDSLLKSRKLSSLLSRNK
jgi:hypothetical protein